MHSTQGAGPLRAFVVGCGRRLRQDDQAGLRVAEQLADSLDPLPGDLRITTSEAPCASMFDGVDRGALCILIDAAQARDGFPPGTIAEIDYTADPERIREGISRTNTHTLSVEAALTLAKQLDMLPERVLIYAIAASAFEWGEEITPAVEAAVQNVAAQIRTRLQQ